MRVALLILLLTGCATASPITDRLRADLYAAKLNFELANMATEAACIQSALDDLGTLGQSALPGYQVQGVISAGSLAYIAYARTRGSQQSGPRISEACFAVIGKVAVAAGREGIGAFTGGLGR